MGERESAVVTKTDPATYTSTATQRCQLTWSLLTEFKGGVRKASDSELKGRRRGVSGLKAEPRGWAERDARRERKSVLKE